MKKNCKKVKPVNVRSRLLSSCGGTCVKYSGLPCGANLWFGGFPYTVYLGRPEWSKVQTRGKPLVVTAQAKYMSAGEQ